MDVVIIIPARYKSTRLPGKPLLDLAGKSMIQRTWERCSLALPREQIFVATDEVQIENHCVELGIQAIMTSKLCRTGTDRVFEASKTIKADIYINVQGDEPLFNPNDIITVLEASKQDPNAVINGMCPIKNEEEYLNVNVPKVVVTPDNKLLYMSRSPIPTTKDRKFVSAMRQVCVYIFPQLALKAFASEKQKTPLEAIEDIEILRFLELGFEIKMVEVSQCSIPVDTPEDAKRVLEKIEMENIP